MKAEEFYEENRLHGRTEHITGNPNPDYSELFYQNIFHLMEEYAESKLKEEREGFELSIARVKQLEIERDQLALDINATLFRFAVRTKTIGLAHKRLSKRKLKAINLKK